MRRYVGYICIDFQKGLSNHMSGRRSRYAEIAAMLRSDIAEGRLKPGQQLPTERELIEGQNTSVTVVRAALAQLRGEGLIESRQGKGSFVREHHELIRYTNRYIKTASPLSDQDDRLEGLIKVSSDDRAVVPAAHPIAARLRITPGDLVSRAIYHWYADNELIQVSTQYEPMSITKGTSIELPASDEPGSPDVITRFNSIGISVTRVQEHIRARMARPSEPLASNLPDGVPIIEIERTHYADKLAVETAEISIRADRVFIDNTSEIPNSTRASQ
jgi:GntR family transcriptional regulator